MLLYLERYNSLVIQVDSPNTDELMGSVTVKLGYKIHQGSVQICS
jgi:hypothetical protein